MASTSKKRHSIGTIESCVTRLLVSTKHLLESLTQWARHEVDDKFVSDAYVKLGNDFRSASRAFTNAGVDISDIGDVPQALRVILESALSEPASQENLDRFLPNIRNIIVTLLQNLKAKQNRARNIGDSSSNQREFKHSHTNSSPNIQSPPPKSKSPSPPVKSPSPPQVSHSHSRSQPMINHSPDQIEVPKQRQKSLDAPVTLQPPSHSRTQSRDKDEALQQLQSENVLSRRASKRFSAYQYAKLANINPSNALPSMSDQRSPSAQTIRQTIRNPSTKFTPSSPKDQPQDTHIFLSIGKQTKKVFVKTPITFASLRLLFVEKFAYSPGSSDFPSINIVDPKTGVSYELEDQYLSDITTGTLLSLNEEPIDDTQNFKQLEDTVNALKEKFDTLSSDITNSINDAIKHIDIPLPVQQPTPVSAESDKKLPSIDVTKEVGAIENELRVVKQLQSANKKSIQAFVADLTNKVKLIQETGVDASKSSNRIYMEKCHTRLSEESDNLLTKVDDLQDLMEGLRKDVVQRGVRISDQQLKATLKEIDLASTSLQSMTGYIGSEKSTWKKIWESELDRVCEEQQFFNLQDDLTKDLEEDISKIKETFDLIEQCSVEQVKSGGFRRNKVVANLHIPEPGENLHSLKDAVLNEVASLRPDHESRVEAINRAERLRERERMLLNKDEFQEELGNFVDDAKLKKSGGIDEIERQRQLKDAENLKGIGGL
ncbi:bud site selection protein 6 [[Candida] jaroonii]|uniref:Bud site selection protein 6 n=1 Tax=[Candida] jaroonii TaxID=467808 RepID=A0ACA9YF76_9ASCO|nr:bud site selection protein 6 [[Candida] jaroonii]